MSTRCQIGIYEDGTPDCAWEALIYQHSDGYPDSEHGVVAEVLPFLRSFYERRGGDTEYIAARLLQHLCNNYDAAGEAMAAKLRYESHSAGLLGFGICRALHGDIEYFYRVNVKEAELLVLRPTRETRTGEYGHWGPEAVRLWPVLERHSLRVEAAAAD